MLLTLGSLVSSNLVPVYFLLLQIFVSDKLPHKVCIECVEIIKNANKFRMFVKRNDVQLRSMFNSDGQGDKIKVRLQLE